MDFECQPGELIHFRCFIHSEREEYVYNIKLLPPVRLMFRLPKDYPSDSAPSFNVDSEWMTEKQHEACNNAIQKVLNENQGMMVVFLCYQAVLDTLTAMDIKFINLNRSFILKTSVCAPNNILSALI